MGGQAGGRGYLVQAFTSVLDALTNDQDWTAVALDPDLPGDKVDILWEYPTRRKVVQVKSSQNQINVPDAKRWCQELETSIRADEYELRLIGPVSGDLPALKNHGRVVIPTPRPLDPDGLLHQAAHQLDRYLRARQLAKLEPAMREMIVDALVTRLSTFATKGHSLGREVFDGILRTWISNIPEVNDAARQSRTRTFEPTAEEVKILRVLSQPGAQPLLLVQLDCSVGYVVLLNMAEAAHPYKDPDGSLRYFEAVQNLHQLGLLHNPSGDGQQWFLTRSGREAAKQLPAPPLFKTHNVFFRYIGRDAGGGESGSTKANATWINYVFKLEALHSGADPLNLMDLQLNFARGGEVVHRQIPTTDTEEVTTLTLPSREWYSLQFRGIVMKDLALVVDSDEIFLTAISTDGETFRVDLATSILEN